MQETWTTGPPSEGGDSGGVIDAAIKANFAELYSIAKDASVYGLLPTSDPDADASDNVAAIQAALDNTGIITIRTPGIYDVNDTIYISPDTAWICTPGVILRKTASYVNVVLNKGALTRTYDENITVMGLEISVNGFGKTTGGPVETLTGNIAFYYVRYLQLTDFKCLDIGSSQFYMSLVRHEHSVLKNFNMGGDKDGINIGVGHDILLDNVYADVFDDGIKLHTTDYPEFITETGDIYNVTIRNYTDVYDSGNGVAGYTLRLLYGSWADWSNGNSYKKGDICVNGGRIYSCMLSDSGFPVNGTDAPVHSSESVKGADGITWRWMQDGSFYKGDIYNVTIDNVKSLGTRAATIGAVFIDDVNTRSVYPGTETLSKAYNIQVINSNIKDNPTQVFISTSNVKDLTFTNCIVDNVSGMIVQYDGWDYNDNLNVILIGCIFKNKDGFVLAYNGAEGQTIDISATACRVDNATIVVNDAGADTPIRLVNMDLPLEVSELDELTPNNGDICRTTESLAVYKSGIGWMDVGCAEYGPELVPNGHFIKWGVSWPTNWAGTAFDANNYVEQDGSKMRVVADKIGFVLFVPAGAPGDVIMLMTNCTAFSGAGANIYQGSGQIVLAATGITGAIVTATDATYLYIYTLGVTDFTLDWVSMKKVLAE